MNNRCDRNPHGASLDLSHRENLTRLLLLRGGQHVAVSATDKSPLLLRRNLLSFFTFVLCLGADWTTVLINFTLTSDTIGKYIDTSTIPEMLVSP